VFALHVTSSTAAATEAASGFSWGTLLLVIAGFLALAVVSSLGFIARIRDRATERRVEAARAERGHPDAPSATG